MATQSDTRFLNFILRALFYGLILFAIAIQAIWFLDGFEVGDLPAWSNYGQMVASLFAAGVACYLYFSRGDRLYMITAFACAGWFMSNTFWYLYTILIDRNLVYPSTGDVGFLGFMLLMTAAIGLTYRVQDRPKGAAAAYLIVLPGLAGLWLDPRLRGVVSLAYYACVAATVSSVVQRYDGRDRLVFIGVLLYCGTMLMYILRETFFPDNLVFTLVGQLVIVSFSVLGLGLLGRADRQSDSL